MMTCCILYSHVESIGAFASAASSRERDLLHIAGAVHIAYVCDEGSTAIPRAVCQPADIIIYHRIMLCQRLYRSVRACTPITFLHHPPLQKGQRRDISITIMFDARHGLSISDLLLCHC